MRVATSSRGQGWRGEEPFSNRGVRTRCQSPPAGDMPQLLSAQLGCLLTYAHLLCVSQSRHPCRASQGPGQLSLLPSQYTESFSKLILLYPKKCVPAGAPKVLKRLNSCLREGAPAALLFHDTTLGQCERQRLLLGEVTHSLYAFSIYLKDVKVKKHGQSRQWET